MQRTISLFAVALLLLVSAGGRAWAANEGQEDLDKATDAKLSATTLSDLDEVIRLTDSALKAGLDEGNTQFANGLLASSLAQRGGAKAALVFRNTSDAARLADVTKSAIEDLDRSVKLDPKQAQAWFYLAQLHRLPGGDEKRSNDAIDQAVKNSEDDPEIQVKALLIRAALTDNAEKKMVDLDKAVKLAPNEASAVRTRGVVLADMGKYQESLPDLTKAIELDPQHGPTFEAKAIVLARLKKYDEALVCLDQAQQLSPQSIAPLLQKARIHALQANMKAAALDLEQARKLEPKNPGILLFLASLEDDPVKKMASINEAVRMAPGSPLPLRTRALLLADQGKFDEALADLDKCLKLEPKEASNFEAKALVLSKVKRYDDALKTIDELLKIDAKLLAAYRLRAMILSDAGRETEAVAELEKLVKDNPNDSNTLLQLAMFHTTKKRSGKALEIYNRVLEKTPEDWAAVRGRGDAYLNIGKQVEAIADYERVLKALPQESGALNNLAWVLCTSPDDKLRDGKRAVKLANEACEATDYKAAHILSTLAAAYAETGDFATAIKWVEKGIALGDEEEKKSLAKELESYRAGKPIREILSETGANEKKP